jgi:hypothetical protein
MPELKSVVRLKSHPNRTPTGRASATATRKLVNYLAFGRGPTGPPGPAPPARHLV